MKKLKELPEMVALFIFDLACLANTLILRR